MKRAIVFLILGASLWFPTLATAGRLVSYTHRSTGVRVVIEQAYTDRKGEKYYKPAHGHVWEMIRVMLHNGSKHQRNAYGPGDFSVIDQRGQSYFPTIGLVDKPILVTYPMRTGETRRGWIGFDLPPGTRRITLTWDDAATIIPPVRLATYRIK